MVTSDVSIILPTFNRADILEECLNHVVSQDYDNWELIIIDDCSQDETKEIATKFSKKYPNIKYFRNSINKGLPASRNIGILESTHNLVFFIEDDLFLNKSCLRILAETYNTLVPKEKVGGIMPRLLDDVTPINPKKPPIIFNKFTGEFINNYSINPGRIVETISVHACSLYPKDLIIQAGGYAEKIFKGNSFREETDLNCRIKRMDYKFFFQPKAWAYHQNYRKGGCRVSSKFKLYYFVHRNHMLFVARNFGLKAVYIIPIYLAKYSIIAGKKFISFYKSV